MSAQRIGSGRVDGGDGARLLVLEDGPLDAEVTVLLVHGWGSNSLTWRAVVPRLAGRYRVLAVDIRGHGGTSTGAPPVTIERVVHDLATVCELTGSQKIVVVGHSLGGTIATQLSICHSYVVGLVVVDPSYGADDAEMAGAPARLAAYRGCGAVDTARTIVDAFAPDVDPSVVLVARHALLASDPDALADLYEANYLLPGAVGPERAAREWLKLRRCPTLAIFPDEYRARLDRTTTADVEVWPGAGHFIHERHPEAFAQHVVRWIAALDGT